MIGERTYLDYNASAPLRQEARAAMLEALALPGNASSVHAEGRRARGIVEAAREHVARLVGSRSENVVFTSGATEANVWAIGAGWQTIVTSGIEHDSVLAPARRSKARLIGVPATADGVAMVQEMAACLDVPSTSARGRTLVTLQAANSETGVLQPVEEVARSARARGAVVHTDAVQAAGRVRLDFAALGVDLMSLSAHKIGGPKGVGALILRDGLDIEPLLAGGGQEGRRRAGTENVAAIAGFGAAAQAAARDLGDMPRIAALRESLEACVRRLTPDVVVIGSVAPRLANTSCIAVPGDDARMLLIKLDLAGVAVSAGSACSSGKVGPSHVLSAMGLMPAVASAAIRVSLGHETTERDVERFVEAWRSVHQARGSVARSNPTAEPRTSAA